MFLRPQLRDVTVVVGSVRTPTPPGSSLPSAVASGALQVSDPVIFSFNDPGIVYVELRSLDASTVALLGGSPPNDYNVLTGLGAQAAQHGWTRWRGGRGTTHTRLSVCPGGLRRGVRVPLCGGWCVCVWGGGRPPCDVFALRPTPDHCPQVMGQ